MKKKIKVAFMLPTLHAGGAERVISYIYKNFNTEDFSASLLITGLKSESKFYQDDKSIIFLNNPKVRQSFIDLVKHIRKNKPDIVFSSLSHLNILLAYISVFFPNIVFIGRETFLKSDTSDYKIKKSSKFYKLLSRIALKKLDFLVCQSEDMKRDFESYMNIPSKKVRVINNPITNYNEANLKTSSFQNRKEVKFITVGRYSKIKGYDRILRNLSELNYPYTYTIIGTGNMEQTQAIESLIKTLKIDESVKQIPYTNNVSKYLKKADFFLQGSYMEGFPNALLESCAIGLPVIAFDVPGGTKNIVEHEVNGYLVKDESEFLSRLNSLYSFDPQEVSHSVMKKFSTEIILKQYENLFIEAIEKNEK